MSPAQPLLAVRNLTVSLPGQVARSHILRDVNFQLGRGECLGIVGESGSGKSMTALAIIGLLPDNARVTGTINLDGQEIVGATERVLCRIRGNRIGMIFQEPMTALNPAHTIGHQIAEGLRLNRGVGNSEARKEALHLIELVGIADADQRIDDYPHQLSGGQRQRVVIAIALACQPELLIADEPTSALDVTVQAQILDLLAEICEMQGKALILISHDLGVVSNLCERTVVMYAGSIVESGPTETLFNQSAHPYTRSLIEARPQAASKAGHRLKAIPGTLPNLDNLPKGCVFHPRCSLAITSCRKSEPTMVKIEKDHISRCIRIGDI